MATSKQIHWMGEVAQGLLSLGAIYLIYTFTGDRGILKPTVHAPMWARMLAGLVVVLLFATWRTHRHYRRLERAGR